MNFKALTKADLESIARSGEGGIFKLGKDGKLSTASIVFIAAVCGGLCLIVLASVLVCYVCKQRKKQKVIIEVIEKHDHIKNKQTINLELNKMKEYSSPEKMR